MFTFIAGYSPPPPAGSEQAAPPPLWGDPNIIRERLGDAVTDLKFARATLVGPALSVAHFRNAQETTIGQLKKLIASLAGRSGQAGAELRAEFEAMAADMYEDNAIALPFLMTRATKV